MLFCVVLVLILIVLGVLESLLLRLRQNRVPVRILVNGTRGKTTVTRLIASALQEAGYQVLAKTTGSEAVILLPDGSQKPVDRRFGLNVVREQYSFFRLASQVKANAVVVECMAVRPENQILMADRLVRPTLSVITNARIDHVDQMGSSIESTCEVLLLSVPEGKNFFTSDENFCRYANAVLSKAGEDHNQTNRNLVLDVCRELGVSDEIAEKGMESFIPDIGLLGPFNVDGHHIVNAFASNDIESASEVLSAMEKPYSLIYNNRRDREFRLELFAGLFAKSEVNEIIVIGDNLRKCSRLFEKLVPGCEIIAFKGDSDDLLRICRPEIVCMGNIKGKGQQFIEFVVDMSTKETK